MDTHFVLGRDYKDAKCMVQNRTCSQAAGEGEWVGLYGTSIEGANLAIINRRKPITQYEIDTFGPFRKAMGFSEALYSEVLDAVWPSV